MQGEEKSGESYPAVPSSHPAAIPDAEIDRAIALVATTKQLRNLRDKKIHCPYHFVSCYKLFTLYIETLPSINENNVIRSDVSIEPTLVPSTIRGALSVPKSPFTTTDHNLNTGSRSNSANVIYIFLYIDKKSIERSTNYYEIRFQIKKMTQSRLSNLPNELFLEFFSLLRC
ncbi:unnamed protein product [Adineta ricciae]|uniref:Uncharacterized protein n=1 Tax=Adineta ricciae TaxID=249248 RepID=A0A815H326_ADIRI|nr:unnamed protein product [Adineta ricciae]